MDLIADIFGHNMPDEQLFGIEMELEGIDKNLAGILRNWFIEADGSLRDRGYEFVLRRPCNVKDCKNSLQELTDVFNREGVKPLLTNLASTHIHIDVRTFTVKQLKDLICLLMIVEEDLSANSGPDRNNNYFALSTSCSSDIIRDIASMRDKNIRTIVQDIQNRDERYRGINLVPLIKYGSLEVRYLGACPEPMEVQKWINFYERLVHIVKAGVDFNNLVETVSIGGADSLKDLLKSPFELTFDNVMDGIRNAQPIFNETNFDNIPCLKEGNGIQLYFDNQ